MNDRERFVATLTFKKPDRVLFEPGHGRESTRANWRKQGLPNHVDDCNAHVRTLLGIHPASPPSKVGLDVVMTMRPEFEEKIIEERPGSRIVQDWKGNVCEIGKQFDPSYLRGAPDFVTRSWLKCPVESRDDWPDMARRYDASDPARFPEDFARRCESLTDRQTPLGLIFSGPFWQLREWVGFENLCMLFIDDPAFARQMIDFWQDYVARMLSKLLGTIVPDYIMFNEDMAYKEKPMIGPEMCRRFLLPCWTNWCALCRDAGVPVIGIDSDGHIGELIPVWLDAGVNWTSPLEVAAGNNLPAYRTQYGTRLSYSGGVDKRAIAAGGDVIRREIDRLRPVIDAGGYIPGMRPRRARRRVLAQLRRLLPTAGTGDRVAALMTIVLKLNAKLMRLDLLQCRDR